MSFGLAAWQALVAVVAKSRVWTTRSKVVLYSLSEYLLELARSGLVHDVRRVKESYLASLDAGVEGQQADAMVKRATAIKTIAEAVAVVTREPAQASREPLGPSDRLAEAEANFRRVLATYVALGGTVSIDVKEVEGLRALLAHEPAVITLDSTVPLPLKSVSALQASVVGGASASADLSAGPRGVGASDAATRSESATATLPTDPSSGTAQ